MARFKRILHPSDFSRASSAAFAKAVQLAKDNRAQLLVMHALSLPLPGVGGEGYVPAEVYEELERSGRDWARKRLDKLVTRAKQAGVSARGLLVEGSPYDRITRAARANRADLIVIGTHGRTALGRLFLGSVATRVLSTATCPVMTVRAR